MFFRRKMTPDQLAKKLSVAMPDYMFGVSRDDVLVMTAGGSPIATVAPGRITFFEDVRPNAAAVVVMAVNKVVRVKASTDVALRFLGELGGMPTPDSGNVTSINKGKEGLH